MDEGQRLGQHPSKQSVLGLHISSGASMDKDTLSQVYLPNSKGTGVLGRPSTPSCDPSLILIYPEAHSETQPWLLAPPSRCDYE